MIYFFLHHQRAAVAPRLHEAARDVRHPALGHVELALQREVFRGTCALHADLLHAELVLRRQRRREQARVEQGRQFHDRVDLRQGHELDGLGGRGGPLWGPCGLLGPALVPGGQGDRSVVATHRRRRLRPR